MEYYLRMSRRTLIQDAEDQLEEQFYIINKPEGWERTRLQVDPVGPDGQAEIPITDPRQLDHWFNSMAAQRGMTGAEAERMFSGPNQMLLGFAEGEGRRV